MIISIMQDNPIKLTLWHQFSGNHSSSFTVVGEFATHEDAVRAAAEIRRILDRLDTWHTAHAQDEDMIEWWSSGEWGETNSPIEDALAAEYNVQWQGGIDWSNAANIEIVMDRLVFITPTRRPEADGQPFGQIMTRLGGKGYHEGDVYSDTTGWFLFDITCLAPDVETADELRSTYNAFRQRVEQNGRALHFARWRFYNDETSFRDLIALLHERSCTDIEYHFTQVDLEGDNFDLYTPQDVPLIIKALLEDDDYYGELWSARNWLNDARAAEPLIEALKVGNDQMREMAINFLTHIGAPAIAALEKALAITTDDKWRETLQNALNKINANRKWS